MGRLGPNKIAYNAAIDALNGHEDALERIVEDRDRAWVAAETLCGTGTHGKNQRRRNFVVNKGLVRR